MFKWILSGFQSISKHLISIHQANTNHLPLRTSLPALLHSCSLMSGHLGMIDFGTWKNKNVGPQHRMLFFLHNHYYQHLSAFHSFLLFSLSFPISWAVHTTKNLHSTTGVPSARARICILLSSFCTSSPWPMAYGPSSLPSSLRFRTVLFAEAIDDPRLTWIDDS